MCTWGMHICTSPEGIHLLKCDLQLCRIVSGTTKRYEVTLKIPISRPGRSNLRRRCEVKPGGCGHRPGHFLSIYYLAQHCPMYWRHNIHNPVILYSAHNPYQTVKLVHGACMGTLGLMKCQKCVRYNLRKRRTSWFRCAASKNRIWVKFEKIAFLWSMTSLTFIGRLNVHKLVDFP